MPMKAATRAIAVRTLVGAAVLAGVSGPAFAQPFFRAFGGYYGPPAPFYDEDYDGGPYGRPYYAPGPGRDYAPGPDREFGRLGPREIARAAASAGFRLIGPPRATGRTYQATGEDRGGRRHRLVFDAGDGRIVDDRLLHEAPRASVLPKVPAPPKQGTPVMPAKAEPAPPVPVPTKIEPDVPAPPPIVKAAPEPPPAPPPAAKAEPEPAPAPPAVADQPRAKEGAPGCRRHRGFASIPIRWPCRPTSPPPQVRKKRRRPLRRGRLRRLTRPSNRPNRSQNKAESLLPRHTFPGEIDQARQLPPLGRKD